MIMGEQEKVDQSGSLPVKPGELAGLSIIRDVARSMSA